MKQKPNQTAFDFDAKLASWRSRGSGELSEPVGSVTVAPPPSDLDQDQDSKTPPAASAEPSPQDLAAAAIPKGAKLVAPAKAPQGGPKPYGVRSAKWNFVPGVQNNFKLSRSKLDLFLECPRCFYLDNRLGIKRTSMPSFNLNTAVDTLLKREFDGYRATQQRHPIMEEYDIDALPFQHADIDVWRENFTGAQYFYQDLALWVTAVPDDIWVRPNGELIIVDYKSTSTNKTIDFENDYWKQGYKRQIEVYQDVFRRLGFEVSDTAYFVYANGRDSEEHFGQQLVFDLTLHEHRGDASWVEDAVRRAHACLSADVLPDSAKACEHCLYRRFAAQSEAKMAPSTD